MSVAPSPGPEAPKVNPAAAPDRFASFMQQVANSKTELQYYHFVEGLINSDNQDQRVAAMNTLMSLDLSMLGRFEDKTAMQAWHSDYAACGSFLPIPKLAPSTFPGIAATYYIEIAKGERMEFLPAEYNSACEQARRNQAALCLDRMRKLHARAREHLVRHKFLVDQLSVPDDQAAAAAARQAEFATP